MLAKEAISRAKRGVVVIARPSREIFTSVDSVLPIRLDLGTATSRYLSPAPACTMTPPARGSAARRLLMDLGSQAVCAAAVLETRKRQCTPGPRLGDPHTCIFQTWIDSEKYPTSPTQMLHPGRPSGPSSDEVAHSSGVINVLCVPPKSFSTPERRSGRKKGWYLRTYQPRRARQSAGASTLSFVPPDA